VLAVRRLRGIGAGAAFAVLVLAVVSTLSLLYLTVTYRSAVRGVEEYALAAQKPSLSIVSVKATSQTITVRIVNNGPVDATIYRVEAYRYSSDGIPSTAVEGELPATPVHLGVGDSVKVTFNVPDVTDFMYWGMPLRVLVVTDRGPIILSYPLQLGTIYVNIRLPTWVTTSNILDFIKALSLEVQGPDGNYSIPLTPAYGVPCTASGTPQPEPFRSFGYTECSVFNPSTNGYTIVVKIRAIAGYTYKLLLVGEDVEMPGIAGDTEIRLVKNAGAVAPSYIYMPVSFTYSSVVSVAPGSSVSVDFTIPDNVWREGKPVIPHQSGGGGSNGWVIDFSNYFNNYKVGAILQGYGSRNIGLGAGEDAGSPDQIAMNILTLGGWLVYSKVVSYDSPAGCTVYPVPVAPRNTHPPVPDEVKDAALTAYRVFSNDFSRDYITGMPFIIDRLGSCSVPSDNVLNVYVPLSLNAGRYVILVNFMVTETTDTPIDILVSLKSDLTSLYSIAGASSSVLTSSRPYQFAVPLFVDVPQTGTYYLVISLHTRRLPTLSPDDVVSLVLSKVVILPTKSVTHVCSYMTRWMPWMAVDTSTGTVEDGALADIYLLSSTVIRSNEIPYSALENGVTVVKFAPAAEGWSALIYGNGYRWLSMPYTSKYTVSIDASVTDADLKPTLYFYVAYGNSPDIAMPAPPAVGEVTELVREGFFLVFDAEYPAYRDNTSQQPAIIHVSVVIDSSTPINGYVILPVAYLVDATPPLHDFSVQVYGGTLVGTAPVSTGNQVKAEALIVQAYSSHVVIEMDMPVPYIKLKGIIYWPWSTISSKLAIGPIAVVTPDVTVMGSGASPQGSGLAGIVLKNVQPVLGSEAVVKIIDATDGDVAKTFTILSSGSYLYTFMQLTGYKNFMFWTYPYHQLYVLVENAECSASSG